MIASEVEDGRSWSRLRLCAAVLDDDVRGLKDCLCMQTMGRKMICAFDEPTLISKISVIPRAGQNWRSNNQNITIFETIPADYPPKLETFTGPYSVELDAVDGYYGYTLDVSIHSLSHSYHAEPTCFGTPKAYSSNGLTLWNVLVVDSCTSVRFHFRRSARMVRLLTRMVMTQRIASMSAQAMRRR